MLPVNDHGGGGVGAAVTAGPLPAAAVLSVNGLGGGRVSLVGDIGGASAGPL